MKKALFSGIAILFLTLFIGFSVASNYSIINKSGSNVTGVMISPTGSTGNSISLAGSISKGQTISVDFTANTEACTYDVRFTDDQGREHVMTGVELCGTTELVLVSNKADEVQQIFTK